MSVWTVRAHVWSFLWFVTGLVSTDLLAAEYKPTVERPQCEGAFADFRPFVVAQDDWYGSLVPARDQAPKLWFEVHGQSVKVGFHGAAEIRYWSCDDNGSYLETFQETVVVIYEGKFSETGQVEALRLIGYRPVDTGGGEPVELTPTLDKIDDMNLYWTRFEGSGAELVALGPRTELSVDIRRAESENSLNVRFNDACGQQKPLDVVYSLLQVQ
jgi:hypothetical protein